MADPLIVLAANSAWNILNFRMNLVRSLRRLGARPIAFVPPGGEEALQEARVPVVTIEMKPTGLSPIHDLAAFYRYRSALRTVKPAAFLGFTAKPNIYGSLAAASLRIPAVNNITGLGTSFIHGGALDAVASGLYRLALARSTRALFHNPDDLRLFVERNIISPERATIIPGSGVDLELFRPQPLPGTENRITFLLISRLLWEKGVGEFAAAAKIVKARFKDARFQLLGAIDTGRRGVPRTELNAWIDQGLVEYLGTTDDVRPAIAAADCVVLPSYREGMPRALLEAAAMGRPLIAADTPGCRHIIDDGVNGFLCLARSADALAKSMMEMAANPPRGRQEMGRAARSKVHSGFSETVVEEIYADLLAPILKAKVEGST